MYNKGLTLEQAPPEDIPIRFFLTAPLFGILTGILLFWKGKLLMSTNWSFQTVALTHTITLGWTLFVMIGAYYQMVLVLVGGQVAFVTKARWVHALLLIGVGLFLYGMYFFEVLILKVSGFILAITLLFFVFQVSVALFRVKADRPTIIGLRISVLSLLVSLLLGFMFVLSFSGMFQIPFDRLTWKTVHILFALFGWIVGLIISVGIHVIPMFYLTPSFPVKIAKWILYGLLFSLVAISISLFLHAPTIIKVFVALPGVGGISFFIYEILYLLKNRKRKLIDTNIRFWQIGLINLFFSMLLFLLYVVTSNEKFAFLFGITFLIGFALSITSGMLYKIVPFLIWLHRFSPLIGKVKTPLMQDICSDESARNHWRLFLFSYACILVGYAVNMEMFLQLGGTLLSLASAYFLALLIKAVRIRLPA
ncbi:MAG: hypothetical protein H7A23_20285 [Leptospiraceae bacterium]|nr:hypothetical protein [Leptospiraceae bacterium]MCP5496898.1 hypothetical protein [Leptospiraceae bacterium]